MLHELVDVGRVTNSLKPMRWYHCAGRCASLLPGDSGVQYSSATQKLKNKDEHRSLHKRYFGCLREEQAYMAFVYAEYQCPTGK